MDATFSSITSSNEERFPLFTDNKLHHVKGFVHEIMSKETPVGAEVPGSMFAQRSDPGSLVEVDLPGWEKRRAYQ